MCFLNSSRSGSNSSVEWQHLSWTKEALQQGRIFPRWCKPPPEGSTYFDSVVKKPASLSITGLFSLQMILSSGISLWMGLRSWMSLQEVNHPQDWGPARLGITRCRHAVRPLREPQADLHRRLHRTVEDKVTDSSDLRIRTSIRRDQVRFHKSSCWFAGRSLWSSVSFFSTLQVKPSVRTDKDSTWRNADWTLEIWCCCSTASTLCRIQLYDFYYCLFILMWTVI